VSLGSPRKPVSGADIRGERRVLVTPGLTGVPSRSPTGANQIRIAAVSGRRCMNPHASNPHRHVAFVVPCGRFGGCLSPARVWVAPTVVDPRGLGAQELLTAVFRLALSDLLDAPEQAGCSRQRRRISQYGPDASAFISSEWATALADMGGIPIGEVRRRLRLVSGATSPDEPANGPRQTSRANVDGHVTGGRT
jgi:hypothetical protein